MTIEIKRETLQEGRQNLLNITESLVRLKEVQVRIDQVLEMEDAKSKEKSLLLRTFISEADILSKSLKEEVSQFFDGELAKISDLLSSITEEERLAFAKDTNVNLQKEMSFLLWWFKESAKTVKGELVRFDKFKEAINWEESK